MTANNPSTFQRIMVGIDDGEPAQWALRTAAELASALGATLLLVHVVPNPSVLGESNLAADKITADAHLAGQALLLHARAELPPNLDIHTELRLGSPPAELNAAANHWHPDILILGSRGRGKISLMILGSTAAAVIHNSTRPVLVVSNPPDPSHHRPKAWTPTP